MTKSGRTVKPVKRLLDEMSSVNIENEVQKAPEVDLSTAEENLHEGMNELGEINLLSMGSSTTTRKLAFHNESRNATN